MHINRPYDNLSQHLADGKILIIYGPRQVGKTTMVNYYLNHHFTGKYKQDIGENINLQILFDNPNPQQILEYCSGYQLIMIDEAQKIPHIGEGLKILSDLAPNLKVIVTGSSSFELAGQIGEPLTGRKKTITLYPVSQSELCSSYNPYELKQQLPQYLIFGSYPEVLTTEQENSKQELLIELTQSYLLKDILALDNLRNSKILLNLLRLLAYQIGSEISLTELAQKLNINYKTVARYLDLLEKSFVITSLTGFSKNLRKEITKKNKYYFYDLGIRNALIANFNHLEIRNDLGQLWENFLVIERIKKQQYQKIYANNYFWRTWEKQEIDWIEERNGKLFAYEFKWSTKINSHKPKIPNQWQQYYPEAEFNVVNQDNYLNFVT